MSLPTHQLTCQPGSAVEPHGEAVISAVWFFQSEEFPYVVFSHFYLYMNYFLVLGIKPSPWSCSAGSLPHSHPQPALSFNSQSGPFLRSLNRSTMNTWKSHTEYTFWAKEVYSVGHTLLPPVGVITSGSVVCVCVFSFLLKPGYLRQRL